MQQPYVVAIDVMLDYDVGSPPDDTVSPYEIALLPLLHAESVWMPRTGPIEGILSVDVGELYPAFLDATRRHVFGYVCLDTTPNINWDGNGVKVYGNIWLTTDPSWKLPLVISGGSAGWQGTWFACEGELESDYRIWKKGKEEKISL